MAELSRLPVERTVLEMAGESRTISVNAGQVEFLRCAADELDQQGFRVYPAIIRQLVEGWEQAEVSIVDDATVIAALLHYGLDSADPSLAIAALERRGANDAAAAVRSAQLSRVRP